MNTHGGFFYKNLWINLPVTLYCIWAIILLITCRSHYSVDVILGLWFSAGVVEFYHLRANNLWRGNSYIGQFIMWLEKWPKEWMAVDTKDEDGYDGFVDQTQSSADIEMNPTHDNDGVNVSLVRTSGGARM